MTPEITDQQWKAAFEAEQKIDDLATHIAAAIGNEETANILREIANRLDGGFYE